MLYVKIHISYKLHYIWSTHSITTFRIYICIVLHHYSWCAYRLESENILIWLLYNVYMHDIQIYLAVVHLATIKKAGKALPIFTYKVHWWYINIYILHTFCIYYIVRRNLKLKAHACRLLLFWQHGELLFYAITT